MAYRKKPKCNTLDNIDENSVGFLIRKYRIMKNMTAKDLAEKMGCSTENILVNERNTYIPKLERRIQIAHAIGIPSIWLFPELKEEGEFSLPEKCLSDYSTKELLEEIERRCSK